MSYFNIERNCSPKCEEWEKILDHYRDWVEDVEVWAFARESQELPVLGNVYQNLVLSRILSHFCEETGLEEDDLTLFFFINAIDSHLVINDWDICTVDDYWACIKQHKMH